MGKEMRISSIVDVLFFFVCNIIVVIEFFRMYLVFVMIHLANFDTRLNNSGPVEWPIPWSGLSFMEVHGAVVYNGERLAIPDTCNPVLKDMMACCFGEPDSRPSFDKLCTQLLALHDQLESEEFDVFISYRDESDKELAKDLYITLTGRGWRVFYDKTCIPPGADWKHVFMTAVLKTQVFVCILSKGAINHSSDREILSEQERLNLARRSYQMLRPDSPCDNVLLEHRLARERYDSDNCAIYPVIVGQKDGNGDYSDFFNDGSNPTPEQKEQMNTIVVQSVEDDLVAFLTNQSVPVQERNVTVGQILQNLLRCNGSKIGPCKSAEVKTRIDEAIQGIERTLEGRNRFPIANTMRVSSIAVPPSQDAVDKQQEPDGDFIAEYQATVVAVQTAVKVYDLVVKLNGLKEKLDHTSAQDRRGRAEMNVQIKKTMDQLVVLGAHGETGETSPRDLLMNAAKECLALQAEGNKVLPKLEELLEQVSTQGDEVGTERVLSILDELEKGLAACQAGVAVLHASTATVIATHARVFLRRKKYLRMKTSATRIASAMRGFIARKKYLRMKVCTLIYMPFRLLESFLFISIISSLEGR